MKKFLPQQGGHRIYNDDFITMQQGYEESLSDILKMFKRSHDDTPLKMYGLEMTTSGSNTFVTPGCAYFKEEIFRVPLPFSFPSINYQNIFIKIKEEEIPNIDPIEYKDTSFRNLIHVDRILYAKDFDPLEDFDAVNGFYLKNLTIYDSTPKGTFVDWLPENELDFINSFNSTGLGIGRMSGWAVCNGNNGTPDLRGQFTIMASNNMKSSNSLQSIAVGNLNYGVRTGSKSTNIILSKANLPNYNLDIVDPGHSHNYHEWENQSSIGQGGTSATKNDVGLSRQTSPTVTGISVNSGGSNSPISVNTVSPAFSMIKIKKIR